MAYPNFPIGKVPIPGRPEPLQLPPRYDPAGIIMQAAALQQQRALTQQQLAQEGINNMTRAIEAGASLMEQKRHREAEERMAQMSHDIAMGKLAPETALMQAQTKLAEKHAAYYNSFAGAMANTPSNAPPKVFTEPSTGRQFYMAPGPHGPVPKLLPESKKDSAKQDPQLAAALESLNQLEIIGNSLDFPDTMQKTLINGPIMKIKSLMPSTPEGQFTAIAYSDFISAARALGGRVSWPEIQAAAKSFPSFMDTRDSFKRKIGRIRTILQAAANAKNPDSQAPARARNRYAELKSQNPDWDDAEIYDQMYSEGN